MSDEKRDERSMSEILSSIRRIVTDEEKTRREADEQRRTHEAESGASVFVLTDEMRAGGPASPKPAVDFDEPLHLEPDTPYAADFDDEPEAEPEPEDAAPAEPGEDPIYAAAPVYAADPLYLVEAEEEAPVAPDPVAPVPTAGGLTEDEVEAIVRRVVREELQGTTGQQITRKLKRLIRDEVARALEQEDDGLI